MAPLASSTTTEWHFVKVANYTRPGKRPRLAITPLARCIANDHVEAGPTREEGLLVDL